MGELDKYAAKEMQNGRLWSQGYNAEAKSNGWVVLEDETSIGIYHTDKMDVSDPVSDCIHASHDGDLLARRAIAYVKESIDEYHLSSNCEDNHDFCNEAKKFYGFVGDESNSIENEMNDLGM